MSDPVPPLSGPYRDVREALDARDKYRLAWLSARLRARRAEQRIRELRELREEMVPWMQECGPCDYGLAMPCTCPKGDVRALLAKLHDTIGAAS